MGSLSNLYISQSYQSLIHIGTNNTASATLIGLQDGLGNNIGVSVNTNGDLFLSGSLTASLQQGYLYVGNASGKTSAFATSSLVTNIDTGSLVTTASFNAYTQSINSATQSLFSSASLGLTTASFSGNTLTFTKGNGTTFGVVIPDISGSTIDTGSFATTSSFNSYTSSNDQKVNSLISATGSYATTGSNTFTGVNTFEDGVIANLLQAQSAGVDGGNILIAPYIGGKVLLNKSTEVTGSLIVTQTFTASLQQGYVWVGDASGKTTTISTGSFITESETGSFVTTSSFNSYTQSNDQRVSSLEVNSASVNISIANINTTTASLLVETQNLELFSASALISISNLNGNTGSYATTGSNTFTGDQTLIDAAGNFITLSDVSGSLLLIPKGFTSSSLHLSASSAGTGNLIFKPNSNNGDTIISGSSNIFTNPNTPTAGFKRYIGGSQNYYGSTIAQITGSAAFSPSMNNNIISTGMLMRIPVSSSAYTMNGNVLMNPAANGIQLGTAAATNFEKAVSGLTFTNNVINGSVFATAYKTPLSASVSITANFVAGAVTMNLDSSSFTLAQNNINGTFTINNSYFPGTVTAASATVTAATNIIGGTLTLYTSGSNTTFTGAPRSVQNSLSSGAGNVISASLNGDNSSVNSNNLLGQALLVYGNNSRPAGATAADWGSAFVGRWNAVNNNRAYTADTIFAVGTGRSEATRKTGFLIDSGSNTFIEGTLSISGSTTLSGSLYIQSGSTLPSATGSSILTWNSATGQVSQSPIATLISSSFSVGAFNSTVTQSGSAAVSQSMTFNNTDISNGITLNGGGTQLTIVNNGTYNIQFSAQLLAPTGADTVWIWLKKNGTNVSNTTTKLVLRNNEADVAAWNFVVPAVPTDYFELVWQSLDGHAQLLTEVASGNYPAIPSVIVTVTQVE